MTISNSSSTILVSASDSGSGLNSFLGANPSAGSYSDGYRRIEWPIHIPSGVTLTLESGSTVMMESTSYLALDSGGTINFGDGSTYGLVQSTKAYTVVNGAIQATNFVYIADPGSDTSGTGRVDFFSSSTTMTGSNWTLVMRGAYTHFVHLAGATGVTGLKMLNYKSGGSISIEFQSGVYNGFTFPALQSGVSISYSMPRSGPGNCTQINPVFTQTGTITIQRADAAGQAILIDPLYPNITGVPALTRAASGSGSQPAVGSELIEIFTFRADAYVNQSIPFNIAVWDVTKATQNYNASAVTANLYSHPNGYVCALLQARSFYAGTNSARDSFNILLRRADAVGVSYYGITPSAQILNTSTVMLDAAFTGTVAQAAAITGVAFSVSSGTVAVSITSAVTVQQIYNYWKYWSSQPAQMAGPSPVSQSLLSMSAGVLSISGSLTTSGSGSVSGIYSTSSGQSSQITVSVNQSGARLLLVDNNGTQQYNAVISGTSATLYFPPGATGTWSGSVALYGDVTQTFSLNVTGGGAFSASVVMVPDTTVSASLATASAYTSLSTSQQIRDWIAYYNQTSNGIAAPLTAVLTASSLSIGATTLAKGGTLGYAAGVLTTGAASLSGVSIVTTGTQVAANLPSLTYPQQFTDSTGSTNWLKVVLASGQVCKDSFNGVLESGSYTTFLPSSFTSSITINWAQRGYKPQTTTVPYSTSLLPTQTISLQQDGSVTDVATDYVGSAVSITGAQMAYNALNHWLSSSAGIGSALSATYSQGAINFGSYSVSLYKGATSTLGLSGSTVTINCSSFSDSIVTSGTVATANGSTITGAYIDSSGVHAVISGLDSVGLGNTWVLGWITNANYQAANQSAAPATWTGWNQISGTGNTATIVLQPGTLYQLFLRCPGYYSGVGPESTINTGSQTSVTMQITADADLQGNLLWPQTSAYSSVSAQFAYNASANLIEFTNTSGQTQYIPFLAGYAALESIGKSASMAFAVATPVYLNPTKNGFYLPRSNPLLARMSSASTAGAILQADVSYSDTQAAAYDRFVANPPLTYLLIPQASAALSSSTIGQIQSGLATTAQLRIVNSNVQNASLLIPATSSF